MKVNGQASRESEGERKISHSKKIRAIKFSTAFLLSTVLSREIWLVGPKFFSPPSFFSSQSGSFFFVVTRPPCFSLWSIPFWSLLLIRFCFLLDQLSSSLFFPPSSSPSSPLISIEKVD